MQRVAQRIVDSRRGSSRKAYVIFGNSDRVPVLRNIPGFKRIRPRGLHALLLRTLAPVPFEFYLIVPESLSQGVEHPVKKTRPIGRIPG